MRFRSKPTSALTLASSLALGCFSDAPSVGGDGGTDGTTDGGPSTTDNPGTSSGTTGSDTGSTAGTDDVTSSPATETTAVDSTGNGSTGGGVECDCPATAVFCDGFETDPGPWLFPSGGGGTEERTMGESPCGDTSMLTTVGSTADESYSVLLARTQTSTGEAVGAPMFARTRMRISSGCAAQPGPVRIFEFRLPDVGTGQSYAWRVILEPDQFGISGANHTAAHAEFFTDLPPFDTWIDLRLHAEFSDINTPTARLEIDGVDVVLAPSGAPPIAAAAASIDAPTEIVLGAFLEQATFTGPCIIDYDDVWLSTD